MAFKPSYSRPAPALLAGAPEPQTRRCAPLEANSAAIFNLPTLFHPAKIVGDFARFPAERLHSFKEDPSVENNRVLAISLAAVAAIPFAAAQMGGNGAAMRLGMMGADAGIVQGQPCVVVEKIESVRPLADGTTLTRDNEEQKWRDSQGRFRKQGTEIEPGQQPVFHTANIVDPVANTLTVLNLDRKAAMVYHLPDHGPAALHPYVELEDQQLWARPGVQVKMEKLEGKTIAGVYAVGRRVTRIRPPGTIGNDKTVISVAERWVSPDLKILLYSSSDDPREKLVRQVTQLERSEPDPSVFAIPSDFTVNDVQVSPPQQ
jgi:hypothetical protein